MSYFSLSFMATYERVVIIILQLTFRSEIPVVDGKLKLDV